MNNKKSINEINIKSVEPRYIMINEDIYDALSRDERNVYLALRYESDYSKETSLVKRSIAFIVQKSKTSRRQVFRCLLALETIHYLIQRIEMPVTGIQNNYNVSRTLNFFNPSTTGANLTPIPETSATQALDAKICAHLDKTSATQAPTSATQALPSATQALLIINSFSNSINTTTTVDQILTTPSHSEPVVVSSTALTSTPKVKPLTPVTRMEATTDRELLAAYRAKPFLSINILTEEDFLSACDYLIADRGDIPLRGRIKGIIGLIMSGNFDEPSDWAKEQRNAKNRAKGEAQTRLNEKNAIKNAQILTTAKGRTENLKEMMAKIGIIKEETTKKTCFPIKDVIQLPRRIFKPSSLSEQIDDAPLFDFDMSLVIVEKEIEEEILEPWEARL